MPLHDAIMTNHKAHVDLYGALPAILLEIDHVQALSYDQIER